MDSPRSSELNPRARGWLKYMWRRATTPDDWSEDGEPHAWWDRYSSEPVMDFARFDLSESSYGIAIMADQTPAWREVYSRILDELVSRHTTYWAAIDWLTQFGPDPRRDSYPQEWIDMYIPAHLVGQYDTPGWVANGVEPWGLQADPIGAEGNLFFKGWLNLLMSLHAYVSGSDKWCGQFEVAGVDRTRFEWTQPRIAEHLAEQWSRHPAGLHCENTKVWPYCLSAAGLGLQLYDHLYGHDTHAVYQDWLERTRGDYFGIDKQERLRWVTLFYDPVVEHNQTVGPSGGFAVSLYSIPQAPEWAEFLYHAAASQMRWNDRSAKVRATPDPRFIALGLVLAKEFGDDITRDRLSAYAEEHFEPRFFAGDDSEFGWWFNFGEDWPRGQISALMIMAEIGGPGAWSKLFSAPNMAKFNEPTVEGVDFPTLGICRARNLPDGVLQVSTYASDPGRQGEPTRFRITGIDDTSVVRVRCDGADYPAWRALDGRSIQIEATVDTHHFEILSAGSAKGRALETGRPANSSSDRLLGGASMIAQPSLVTRTSATTSGILLPGGSGCPCCV